MNVLASPESIRESAIKVAHANAEQQAQLRESVETWLQSAQGITTDDPVFTELAGLLALPEDKFAILAPIFLEQYEKIYNESNNQLLLLQTLNVQGVTVEDIIDEYTQLCAEIDADIGTALPQVKKDFLKQMMGITYNSIAGAEGIAKKVVMVPIEIADTRAKLPTYAHLTDAGMDVYALEDITINPGETKIIPTGLKVAIPNGYELQVRPKSGRCVKTKLRIANTPGTIDSGYRDEIGIIVENIEPMIKNIKFGRNLYDANGNTTGRDDAYFGPESVEYGQSYTIGAGEKFAQLVLSEVPKVSWMVIDKISDIPNDGRNGGFGSTSLK